MSCEEKAIMRKIAYYYSSAESWLFSMSVRFTAGAESDCVACVFFATLYEEFALSAPKNVRECYDSRTLLRSSEIYHFAKNFQCAVRTFRTVLQKNDYQIFIAIVSQGLFPVERRISYI